MQMQLAAAAAAEWLTFDAGYAPRSRDVTLAVLLSLQKRSQASPLPARAHSTEMGADGRAMPAATT